MEEHAEREDHAGGELQVLIDRDDWGEALRLEREQKAKPDGEGEEIRHAHAGGEQDDPAHGARHDVSALVLFQSRREEGPRLIDQYRKRQQQTDGDS